MVDLSKYLNKKHDIIAKKKKKGNRHEYIFHLASFVIEVQTQFHIDGAY